MNPVLYAALAVLTVTMFTAFAYWTAAWTRSAESAQLTSLPIIILASLGPMTTAIPDMSDRLRDLLSLTPGAAMSELVRIGWFGFDGPGARGDAELRRHVGPGAPPAPRDGGLDVRGRRARAALDAVGASRLMFTLAAWRPGRT